MNLRKGLERICAVFWGFWALFFLVLGGAIVFQGQTADGFGVLAGLIPVYILYRLTSWVLDGFFSPKP